MSKERINAHNSLNHGKLFTVELLETEHGDKGKKTTPYKLVIRKSDGRKTSVLRKYNDFQTLYDKVKRVHPNLSVKFPSKKLFSSYDNRKDGLAELVEKILAEPKLSSNRDVQDFANLKVLNGAGGFSRTDSEFLLDIHKDQPGSDEENRVNLGPSERTHVRPSDFTFLKVIGKGSFGRVMVAKHKEEGNTYAIKVLNKAHIMKKNEAKHIMSERNVLVKNIKHPFLVGLHYSFQTSDKLYFVLDYVNGGELFHHLQKERCFSEVRARFYAAEISSALNYLHTLDIIYRDLKPENILFDSEGHVVLTDFGLCKEGMIGRQTTSTFCGTPEYLAPEVLRKQPYDKTVDWWCLGAVTYEMIYGLPPFYSRDTAEMYDNILYKPLKFRTTAGSEDARNLLEWLLQKEKEKRLGSKRDFQEVRTHPFFSAIDWNKLEERAIKPPYDPDVDGEMDLKHFDPEFVQEPVPASVGHSHNTTGFMAGNNAAFEGFSYVPSPALDFKLGSSE